MTTTRKTPGRPRGRPPAGPRSTPATLKTPVVGGDGEEVGFDLAVVYGGVSASWLGHVFGMDKNTVKKKLAAGNCTIVGMYKGAPQYTLKEAAAYLVEPKVDIHSYMRTMRYNDLPPLLQAAYWDGMRKRQQYMITAGELWHTEQVLNVLGTLATRIKSTVLLWPDQVKGLTDKQYKALQQNTDSLLNDIHEILVAAPKEGRTVSSAENDGLEPIEDEDEVVDDDII